MGSSSSSGNYEETREKPIAGVDATLYYFGGRGVADQIRWLMAASNISFKHKVIDTREKFLQMAERQLPFGQLPLLQIDGLEIVQSQAMVRYIARRGGLYPTDPAEEVKADMLAEMVRDVVGMTLGAPFMRAKGEESKQKVLETMRTNWKKFGSRFEVVLVANGGEYLVGNSLSYADILLVHALTCYVEECGPDVVSDMPQLVELQHKVMALPGIQSFIRSDLYFPLGDDAYVRQVSTVLGRTI